MVRIKSIPIKFTGELTYGGASGKRRRYGLGGERTPVSTFDDLPNELKRVIFSYAIVDSGTYFRMQGVPIFKLPSAASIRLNGDPSDGSFFFTGLVRMQIVQPNGSSIVVGRRCEPGYERRLYPGATVYLHREDLRQQRLWYGYGKAVAGCGDSNPIAIALDSANWECVSGGSRSCRVSEGNGHAEEEDRARNQVIRTIQKSNCRTHTFFLGLVSQKLYPQDPKLYEVSRKSVIDLCEDGDGSSSGEETRSYDEGTYQLERLARYDGGYFESQENPDCGCESSDSDSDYEEEEEEGGDIDLADYDESDRLYFERRRIRDGRLFGYVPPRRVPDVTPFVRWTRRVCNSHLKSDGVTTLEPISWRISVNPNWASTRNSKYIQPDAWSSTVLGMRHCFLDEAQSQIDDLWENEWTTWESKDDGVYHPHLNLMQHYHVGIVPAYIPQPSFVELSSVKCRVVIPLIDSKLDLDFMNDFYVDEYLRGIDYLTVSHYTLERGLKRTARLVKDMNFDESIISDPDTLYI